VVERAQQIFIIFHATIVPVADITPFLVAASNNDFFILSFIKSNKRTIITDSQ
jgi:hypothetical protein